MSEVFMLENVGEARSRPSLLRHNEEHGEFGATCIDATSAGRRAARANLSRRDMIEERYAGKPDKMEAMLDLEGPYTSCGRLAAYQKHSKCRSKVAGRDEAPKRQEAAKSQPLTMRAFNIDEDVK
jgi:hypothetical protein